MAHVTSVAYVLFSNPMKIQIHQEVVPKNPYFFLAMKRVRHEADGREKDPCPVTTAMPPQKAVQWAWERKSAQNQPGYFIAHIQINLYHNK